MTTSTRLRELDFLRGVAIILVLLRHEYLFQFTKNAGWIGVDLFFTLSGFLVSGLLFKEYLKYGDIQPKRFLIRRGFKIYPIYYLSYIIYLVPIILNNEFNLVGFLADMVFIQNYVLGLGFAFGASWSLAVEEHFYFALAILLWLGIKHNIILLKASTEIKKTFISVEQFMMFSLLLCLLLRIVSNVVFPEQVVRNLTMTHLRIDSLIAGVYISYLFHFKRDQLSQTVNKYKYLLISVAFLGLVWTPFIDPVNSFFVKTIGFTLLYISFGIILLFFILDFRINERLNYLFSTPIVNIISQVGYCSYAIYIIHSFVIYCSDRLYVNYNVPYNHYIDFLGTIILSILAGAIMTYTIERYFLRIRDNYFPARG